MCSPIGPYMYVVNLSKWSSVGSHSLVSIRQGGCNINTVWRCMYIYVHMYICKGNCTMADMYSSINIGGQCSQVTILGRWYEPLYYNIDMEYSL